MKNTQIIGGASLLTLIMVLVGCGKNEPVVARDKTEQVAIEGAKATPKREAVPASKLQNRAGVIYVVNGQEPFQGLAQDFYDNGQMKWEAEIEAGKISGLKRWHRNGVLELTCGLIEGTLNDIDATAFNLLKKDHARLNGEFSAFYDSGQKFVTASFKQGQPGGAMQLWYDNGNLGLKVSFESGSVTQLEDYAKSGQLVGKADFSGAGFEAAFYDLSALFNAPVEKLNGEFVLYHPNGQMAVQCTFENGKIIGEERNWGPDGTEFKTMVVASLGMRMNRVVPGTFIMGSPSSEAGRDNNEIQHSVTISKEYWLGRYEVTQGEWARVMAGANPSNFKGDKRLPVENVSWNDVLLFCQRVTEAERQAGRLPDGYAYTLPTEAQWEFACRAGSTTTYAGDLDGMAWYSSNSKSETHVVGLKQANAWGFFDMHGNVWEWCRDSYGDYSKGSIVDPFNAQEGPSFVFRGGGWDRDALSCRSAVRSWTFPGFQLNKDLGFRLCLAPVR